MKWLLFAILLTLTVIAVTPLHIEYLKVYGKSMPEAISVIIWVPVILMVVINVYLSSKNKLEK